MAAEPRAKQGPFTGLSVKLIATIVLVILAVEILIYVPSIANYRAGWVDNRLRIAIVAGRALDAVPDVMALPQSLSDRLLASAGAYALVYRREGQSQLIEAAGRPDPGTMIVADLRDANPLRQIADTLDTMLFGGNRTLRIVGDTGDDSAVVEILMPERPLRADLFAYSRNIALISLIVAALTGVALYLLVSRILIDPIRRVTANLVAFRQAPENASLILTPRRPRTDEMGVLEAELAAMEHDIFSMLRQRRHLADLGLAVAKINHDLRNTLTSAQLLSDQVANLDDPKVQRLAPRLVTTLDKAIGFAQSVLDYGRQSVAPPKPVPVDLRSLVEESALDANIVHHPEITFSNQVPDQVSIRVDPDQFGRVLVNLLKNAREALEAAGAKIEAPAISVDYAESGDGLTLGITDNGPGLPPRARDNLFVAFEGSARAGGTGLGLAISHELTEAHGGKLAYVPPPQGTRFEITLPRSTRLP